MFLQIEHHKYKGEQLSVHFFFVVLKDIGMGRSSHVAVGHQIVFWVDLMSKYFF